MNADKRRTAFAPSVWLAALSVYGISAAIGLGSVNDALQSYNRGKYGKARSEFERLAKKAPDDPRYRFNAGAAAFQDGEYEEALRHFSSSLSSTDLKLQEKSYYNLGNTQYRLGAQAKDAKEKQQSWEQAIHDYENAIKLDPKDEDAKANIQVVKEKLEELKKQQQQQQNKDQQNKDQKGDDKQDGDKNQQDKKDQQQQKKDEGQDKKDDQQKQDEQKQDQQKQEQQKQEQSKQGDKQQDQQTAKDERGKEPGEAAQAAQYARPMLMTPQQAAQLLEAQKAEEKAMVFIPQTVKTNKNAGRLLKDW